MVKKYFNRKATKQPVGKILYRPTVVSDTKVMTELDSHHFQ